ncbi:MAG: hypothetical protein NT175_04005 [Bacteroidetes bacterium]|nr:hypothetical protein [Bacteroidota bacterium]
MKIHFRLILILIFKLSLKVSSQEIEFFREDLTFQLDTTFFTVDGDYYFRNTSSHPEYMTFWYPISYPDRDFKLDSALIFDFTNNQYLKPAQRTDSGFFFKLNFSGREIKKVKIFYRQTHNGRNATYILTTTKYWKKPLEVANYSLITDKRSILIDSLSYQPDKSFMAGDNVIFEWKRKNLMPDKDFTFWFHRNTDYY